jgi:glycosyltransferase involved in cell wall biosynthesis
MPSSLNRINSGNVPLARSLHFCMVTTFYPPHSFGGDGIFVRDLSRELVARGHRVDVVYNLDAFRALGGKVAVKTATEENTALQVRGVRSVLGRLSPLLTHQLGRPVGFARELRQILQRPYDVVHFHNASLMGAPAALTYARGVKLYTTHEAWLICPTHTLFRFNRAVCERPHCASCMLVHRRPPQWWRYTSALDRALAELDAVISPSLTNMQIHRARGVTVPFTHLPNFVPDRDSLPAAASSNEFADRPYFLYVGRLEAIKGVQTLLPVFARLGGEAELLVAGTGSIEPSLRVMAPAQGVRFLGHQPMTVLRRLYQDAIAAIVPSLSHEVFPLVVLEALREGTPVLVRNRGALPEMARASGGGWVWSHERELVTQIRTLLADPALRNQLGAQGEAHLRTNWSTKAHLDRYLRLISDLAIRKCTSLR